MNQFCFLPCTLRQGQRHNRDDICQNFYMQPNFWGKMRKLQQMDADYYKYKMHRKIFAQCVQILPKIGQSSSAKYQLCVTPLNPGMQAI